MVPLWWSPYPATLDGLAYASLAERVLTNNGITLSGFRADAFASTLILSISSAVTGEAPLLLAQPLYAVIGAAPVIVGYLFARRLGTDQGLVPSRTRLAGLVVAVTLAVDGIFVRRTGVPDDDTLTLLLIPVAAYLAYQYTERGHERWLAALIPLLIVLPITHTFSTLVAGLTLTILWLLCVHKDGVGRPHLLLGGLLGGFWSYVYLYYEWAASSILVVPYVDRVTGHFGVFIAWVIVLALGTIWFLQTSKWTKRSVSGVAVGLLFLVVAVNALTSVFPGTAQTPRLTLLFVLPLAVPAGLAVWGAPLLSSDQFGGTVLAALFVAPFVQVFYSFTVALTPEFFATAMRAQTHLHLSVLVLAAAVAVGTISTDHRSVSKAKGFASSVPVRSVLVLCLVGAVVATLPVAYLHLDTGTYPATTTESDFQAATFVVQHITVQWTSSGQGVRVAGNYHTGVNATIGPTVIWLQGGPSPQCPVLSWSHWTTTGAHLFPAAPETIAPDEYAEWLSNRNQVYASGGSEHLTMSLPSEDVPGGC
jgi:hypothetical protein